MLSNHLRGFFGAALLLLAGWPSAVQAQYSFSTNLNGTLNVTSYTGSDSAVTIPDTDTSSGLAITSVGTDAFFKLNSLTSVTMGTNMGRIAGNAFFQCPYLAEAIIPSTVTNIGDAPFADCQSLAVIAVDPSNAFYLSTNELLFNKATTTLIQFPGGVTGGYELPANVTSVGSAFEGNSLSAIAVDPGNLFYSSTNGVLFNKSKTTLIEYPGQLAGFYVVPNSVSTIASASFEYNIGLAGVSIGSNVVTIGGFAFYDSANLQAIVVDTNNYFYSSTNGALFNKNQTLLIQYPLGLAGSYAVPPTVTSIASGAFGDAAGLADVVIPDTVTSIGAEAFYACENLTSIDFGNGVASIGTNAFYYCASLNSISLPDSVTNIEQYAFYGCTGLTSAQAGDGVVTVGPQAFAYCFTLGGIEFAGNQPTADTSVFQSDPVTVYYEPGTSGWGPTFGGAQAVMLNPPSPAGLLEVNLGPIGAAKAGAQWQVDGGVLQPGGAIVLGLTAGNHTVSFTTIPGWTTPASQTLTVAPDATNYASGTYTAAVPMGSLLVTIQPSGATNAGAQWQVDGGTWMNSGATVSGLSVAQHTVSFSTITGWTTPGNQTVVVSANTTATTSGTYVPTPTGSVSVKIGPPDVLSYEPQWRVDGEAFTNSSATVSGLSLGQHTISFSTISGWATPSNQTVTVSPNGTTMASGTYVVEAGSLAVTIGPPTAAAAGAKWQVDGGALQKSAAVVSLSLGTHTVSFNTISGWTAPANQTVTITEDATTTATGTYVALPPTGSLEVSLSPATVIKGGAQWQVDGGGLLNSGATVSNLAVGSHVVSFTGLNYWNTPVNQTVTVKAKAVTKATGTYTFGEQGTYNGLFSETAGVTEETAGMLSNLKIGAQGTYTTTLLIGGGTYSVIGAFDSSGSSHTNVTRPAASGGRLALQMSFNGNSPGQVIGMVSGTNLGGWTANLTANPSAKTGSAEYTVLLTPGAPVGAGVPPGDGYLLLTNHAGVAMVTGALADGTSLTATSQSVAVDAMGDVPIYDSLYAKTGLLTGWINLTNMNGVPSATALTWIKKPSRATLLYTNGFTNLLFPQGEPWVAPAAKVAAIPLNNGSLVISDTGLFLSYNVGVSNNNALVKLPGNVTNSLSGTITAKTGLLTITFGDGPGKTTVTGTAAVLQNVNSAGGFFLGKTNAGSIVLQP